MKHQLLPHICCWKYFANCLVLSFLNFRCHRFERGNFVVAKTLRLFTDSRGSEVSWHADASASVGPYSLTTSKNTKTVNSLSLWFGFSSITIAQGHRGQIPAVFAFHSLVEAMHFYIAQLYNNSIAVLNKIQSSERKLVAIERQVGTLHDQKMNNLENWMH